MFEHWHLYGRQHHYSTIFFKGILHTFSPRTQIKRICVAYRLHRKYIRHNTENNSASTIRVVLCIVILCICIVYNTEGGAGKSPLNKSLNCDKLLPEPLIVCHGGVVLLLLLFLVVMYQDRNREKYLSIF